MTNDTDKAEELLKQSKSQKRHETDPAVEESRDQESLEDAVADAYARIESGDMHQNLSVRDANLAALVAGLESTGRLEAVGRRAAERLGRDVEVDNRAALVSVLLRFALDEVAAEEVAAAKAGKKKYLVSQDDEF